MAVRWANIIGKVAMGARAYRDPMLYVRCREDRSGQSTSLYAWDRDSARAAAEKAPGSPRDKRLHPRYSDGQETICYPISALPFKVKIMDASLGGLKIQSRSPVALQSEIGIVLSSRGRSSQILVKVLRESRHEDCYEYGVEYIKAGYNNIENYMDYVTRLAG